MELQQHARLIANLIDRLLVLIETNTVSVSKIVMNEAKTPASVIAAQYRHCLSLMHDVCLLVLQDDPAVGFPVLRHVYEDLVIIDFLCKNRADTALSERFYDSSEILELLQIKKRMRGFMNQADSANDLASYRQYESQFSDAEKKLRIYAGKYDTYFSRAEDSLYWWADVKQFSELAEMTDYPQSFFSLAPCVPPSWRPYDEIWTVVRPVKGLSTLAVLQPLTVLVTLFQAVFTPVYDVLPALYSERTIAELAELASALSELYNAGVKA